MENRKKGFAEKFITWMNRYSMRGVAFLLCVSMLFSVPMLTQSRYIAYISGYTVMGADEYYFGSNMLLDVEGTSGESQYVMSGWTGKKQDLTFEIRNYENDLLYKANDTEFSSYVFEWDMTMYDKENNVLDPQKYPYLFHYNVTPTTWNAMGTGETHEAPIAQNCTSSSQTYMFTSPKCCHAYSFTIEPVDENDDAAILPESSYIVLNLSASTLGASDGSVAGTFSKTLKSKVIIRRANQQVLYAEGNRKGAVYTYTLKTEEIALRDGDIQNELEVTVRWNGQKLAADETSTIFHYYIAKTKEQYYSSDKYYNAPTTSEYGKLKMTMNDHMSVQLVFYAKNNEDIVIDNTTGLPLDVTVEITDKTYLHDWPDINDKLGYTGTIHTDLTPGGGGTTGGGTSGGGTSGEGGTSGS